jgi:ferritin-like metal-binding protein YciE
LQYLHEAHATEQALVTNLRAHIAMTPSGSYRRTLERHLVETRQHARAVDHRIGELGGGPRNLVGYAYGALQTVVGQALVLTKGPLDMIRGVGGEEKLVKNAKDEAATEMLEIATYDALEELARATGDDQTARLAARHRGQEERALRELRAHIPRLTNAAVLARAGGKPSYDWETTGAVQSVKSVASAAARAGEPPIADYDSLNASEVVSRLTDLTQTELGLLLPYERANRNRSTITSRARSLQENEPFAGYDELTGRDVATRLRESDEKTVAAAREYEGRHRRRVEVLEAAQRQLSDQKG